MPTFLPEFNAACTEVVNTRIKQNLYMCVYIMQLYLAICRIIHMIQIEVRVPVYLVCVWGDGAEQHFTPSHQVLSNLPHSSSSMDVTTTTSGFYQGDFHLCVPWARAGGCGVRLSVCLSVCEAAPLQPAASR